MRAAFAEVSATNWSSEIRPVRTPSEYSMGISVSRSGSSRSGGAAAVQRGGGRQVHDVDARAGPAGDADGCLDRGHLGGDRAGLGEVRHRAAARRDQLLPRPPEHRAVLAVQQHHRAGRPRGAGRREQGGLVGREVRGGQEQLDARVAGRGEGGNLARGQRGGVVEDRVEEPVDRGLGGSAGHLPGDRGARALLGAFFVRHRVGHVGDRRDAAGGELPGARHPAAELGDPAAGDADVRGFLVTGRDHGRAADDEVEAHRSIVARRFRHGTRQAGRPSPCSCAPSGRWAARPGEGGRGPGTRLVRPNDLDLARPGRTVRLAAGTGPEWWTWVPPP